MTVLLDELWEWSGFLHLTDVADAGRGLLYADDLPSVVVDDGSLRWCPREHGPDLGPTTRVRVATGPPPDGSARTPDGVLALRSGELLLCDSSLFPRRRLRVPARPHEVRLTAVREPDHTTYEVWLTAV